MSNHKDLSQLHALEHEAVFSLEVLLLGRASDDSLEAEVNLRVSLDSGEEIVDQTEEDGSVLDDNLGPVEISETSHEDEILTDVGLGSLETTSLSEYRLDCSETPIVMDLLGEQRLSEVVEGHELLGQVLGSGETFRHEHVFANEHNIGHNHCARSEEGFQVLRKFSSSGVTGVHRDEEADSQTERDFFVLEQEHVLGGVDLHVTDSIEDVLHLGGHHRQHFDGDSVELVEASPGAGLGQTHEDLGHGQIVHLVRAVEHHNLQAEGTAEILGGLSLSSSGGAGGSTSHRQVKGLSEGDVTSIGERGDDETAAVADVLVVVVGHPIADARDTNSLLVLGVFELHVELELGLPDEHLLVLDLLDDEVLDHITLVHINGDNGDDLHTEVVVQRGSHSLDQVLDTVDDHSQVVLHGRVTTSLELVEGAGGLLSPENLGGEESNLGAVIFEPLVTLLVDIPVVSGGLGGLQHVTKSGLHHALKIAEVVLDGAVALEVLVERNVFVFLGPHSLGLLGRTGLSWALDEVEALHAIEAIAEILVDLLGVVTVGEDVKQGLVGHKVESSEDLLLLFKVLVQGLLALLDFLEEDVQELFSAVVGTSRDYAGLLNGFTHHVLELLID
mmetsp:Transcript_20734/g.31850  ORF Transcript_20734/g.31850 Transcript_20734/m.31850 type:complete len:616 (-) Transcript_20734:4614-6461(-)